MARLCLVNRSFLAFAREALYHRQSIETDWDRRLIKTILICWTLPTLKNSPALRPLMRSLSVDVSSHTQEQALECVGEYFELCPRIDDLELRGDFVLASDVEGVFAQLSASCPPLRVLRLSFEFATAPSDLLKPQTHFLKTQKTLKHLVLLLNYFDDVDLATELELGAAPAFEPHSLEVNLPQNSAFYLSFLTSSSLPTLTELRLSSFDIPANTLDFAIFPN